MEQQTIIVVGPQGSGKDTQVAFLKEFLNKNDPGRRVVHFDAGTELRAFAKGSSEVASVVRGIQARGELVPGFITSYVACGFFMQELKGDEHLLISGFPRETVQLLVLDDAFKFYKRSNPRLVYINISDEEALKRLLKRGRNDDTEQSIRNRLAWTREMVAKVIGWYRSHEQYKVIDINGEQPREAVHQDILKALSLA